MSKYISLDWLVEYYFDRDVDYYGKYVREDLLSEDTPIIEVSEDCISREWVLEKIDACYGETEYACNLVVALERAVKSAPSVVVRNNRTTAEPQTYITEDRDTQILDAWQVHHRNTTTVEDAPTTEQSCDTCKYRELYECSDCRFASKWERIEE